MNEKLDSKTLADGAEQRLDAQIAEALFGQPGMSKMDVANRVRELRGDGPALLVDGQTAPAGQIDAETLWWLQDAINTMAEGGNQSHVRFLQRLHDTLSAQPYPGGQDALLGYVRVEAIKALREDDEVTGVMVHVEERADSVPVYLAARQPVEEEENVAADTYWTVAEMIEPHVQRDGINPDGALPASVHDSVSILLDHWLKTRQPEVK